MASSSAAVRKAIRGLEDGLHVFTAQLAQETAELKRNVDNQPCTGASFYRNILEDLAQRLEGLGQELQALEGVSVDAVSLEVRRLSPAAAACCLSGCRLFVSQAGQLAEFGACTTSQPLAGAGGAQRGTVPPEP